MEFKKVTRGELSSWVKKGVLDAKSLKSELNSYLDKVRSKSCAKQKEGAKELYDLVVHVWSLETRLARDAADIVCEYVRDSGGLDILLKICSNSHDDPALQLSALLVIEQVMVEENRLYITQHRLFPALLAVAVAVNTSSLDFVQCATGILENLFKVSAEVSLRLIRTGGLDGVTFGCRFTDETVLQHCAAALANCALYGDPKVHQAMVAENADQWLFPLAFFSDSAVKYYALIAICILASQRELTTQVQRSGTLELVLPFLQSQDPALFPQSCPNHAHGRTAPWLQKMVPLLRCSCEEAQALAAFHFAMEAEIKKIQNRLQVFSKIGVAGALKEVGMCGSHLSSRLACRALRVMGQPLPEYKYWDVLNWSPAQVSLWVHNLGLVEVAHKFTEQRVTGNMLVDISMEDLQSSNGIGVSSPLLCRWLLQEVKKLRSNADCSSDDPDQICRWLVSLGAELAVYKVDFVRNRINRHVLPELTEEVLMDMGITSRVDRLKVRLAVEQLEVGDTPDFETCVRVGPNALKKKHDVFLSYRRSNGSQLASLLKVHLQLRGLNVFLDVTGLGSGNFDQALLTTISNSLNMVIVLTPHALDRCLDETADDWVRKELVHAMDTGVHIVPVMDNFIWPEEDSLPADIKLLHKINGVSWTHEYQDACVEKLVAFLHLPATTRRRSHTAARSDSITVT